MRISIAATVITAALLSGAVLQGQDNQRAEKQLLVALRLYEGDKLLASFRLETADNQLMTFVSGGEACIGWDASDTRVVPVGTWLRGQVRFVNDEKVGFDLTLGNTTKARDTPGRFELFTESTRTIADVFLGEDVTLRLPAAHGKKQVWADLSIEKVES